ncbi:MAG: YcxB family protein [Coleofasciculus sp. D1-CHI-01]|uniref:YcxB family protein n=1 Tax=Coleofasciculus sp. D1-CHI-01 TaxID=3068482 RepID=UPI0032F815C9
MMRLEYRLTLNEYIEAMEADGKARNPWLFNSSWSTTIFAIIIALFYGFSINFFAIAFSIFMFWLAIITSPLISKRLYRWQISGNYKNDPRMHQCLTVELDENTIQVTSADATAQYQWKGFDYFIEADNVFNLYVSKKIFFLIPKRVFSNSEQIDSFRNIIIEKINNEPNFFRN